MSFEFSRPLGSEQRGNGEPEWMPTIEEVARARAALERKGLLRHDSEQEQPQSLVSPGQTPWLWWISGALWLLCWPPAIALRMGSDYLNWVPWWTFPAMALFHLFTLASPIWWTERRNGSAWARRLRQVQTLPQILALEPEQFESWCSVQFDCLGYQVQNTPAKGDHGIDLIVSNSTIRTGLVQCKRYRGTVGEPLVRDLYGTMMHENADFGWLVTTGAVSKQARDWAIGKPIELWDGLKLVELARRHR